MDSQYPPVRPNPIFSNKINYATRPRRSFNHANNINRYFSNKPLERPPTVRRPVLRQPTMQGPVRKPIKKQYVPEWNYDRRLPFEDISSEYTHSPREETPLNRPVSRPLPYDQRHVRVPEARRYDRRPPLPAQSQRPVREPRLPEKKTRGKRRKPRALIIVLDILIIITLICAGYTFLKPKLNAKNAQQVKESILDEFAKNKDVVTLEVDRNFGAIVGEQYEEYGEEFMDNSVDNRELSDKVQLNYVGRLSIPKIQVVTPLAAMTSDNDLVSLRFGAGIHPGFSGIGETGITPIFGHRFLTDGRDFNRLDEVQPGDVFYIDYAPTGERYYYDVFEQVIIPQEQLPDKIYEEFDEDIVMLITCHPLVYGESTERLLIYAKPNMAKTTPIPD